MSNGRISWSGVLGMEFKMFQNWFMPSNIQSLHLMIFFHVFKVLTVEDFKNSHVLKSMVFKIQYMKKKWILSHPELHPQNTKSWNSSFWQTASLLVSKLTREYFWPKSNLRPILGSHRSLKEPQKSQNKPVKRQFLM